MNERPILFSAAMVRAILDGRKSQTRRAVKPQPDSRYVAGRGIGRAGHPSEWSFSFEEWAKKAKCPYGAPGSLLWVRETWSETNLPYGTPVISYRAGGCIPIGREDQGSPDYLIHEWSNSETPEPHDGWRSPIYMPRWASRITLEITDVRVQRVQEISEDDARAEGVDPAGPVGYIPASDQMGRCRYQFAHLWDSINAKRGHPWDANPWVWALTFRRVEAAQ